MGKRERECVAHSKSAKDSKPEKPFCNCDKVCPGLDLDRPEFWSSHCNLFRFSLKGRSTRMASIEMGDHVDRALRRQPKSPDARRHSGSSWL
jgi:hypothetical protein